MAFLASDALGRYLAERGLIEPRTPRDSWYAGPWFHVQLWGRRIPIFPMLGFRGAVAVHDVHHMLTGYKTNWISECEIAGWELASGGCGRYAAFWLDRLGFAALGLFCAPSRTLRAFAAGFGKRNLYGLDTEAVLDREIDEVCR